jgi:hypothetical protein
MVKRAIAQLEKMKQTMAKILNLHTKAKKKLLKSYERT